MYPTLYTLDSKGKVRTWRMEINPEDASQYRSVAGIEGGAVVESGWTTAKPKNEGRANATSAAEQAHAEILADYKKKRDRKYHDNRDEVAGSKFFNPMLAKEFEAEKTVFPVWTQPKLDGVRAIATKDGFFSRQGKPFLTTAHIEAALKPLFDANPDLVFDGELYNHDLKADFNAIISAVRQSKPTAEDIATAERLVQYHVYDLPSHPGNFSARRNGLAEVFADLGGGVGQQLVFVQTDRALTPKTLDSIYASYMEAGYEGQMVRLDAPYEQKRSKHLLKRKEFVTEEFPVKRIEEGEGNWAGHAKRAVGELPDGREFGSGIRGTKAEMLALLNGPKPKTMTVRFFDYTPDGMPRFPVAIAFFQGERDL